MIYIIKCGCGYENGRTDRQMLACSDHFNAGSLATPIVRDFLTESELREQIAQEIEGLLSWHINKEGVCLSKSNGGVFLSRRDVLQAIRGK